MTLETWVKEQLEKMFPTCFSYTAPDNISLVSCDYMQFSKGSPPMQKYPPRDDNDGYIMNRKQLVTYFGNQMIKLTDKSPVAVVCFDKSSPVVKKIVCHKDRYERRCKLCRAIAPELPYGRTADAAYFDPKCDKGCIGDQIFWYEEGPHLGTSEDAIIPGEIRNDWSRFSSDSRNLFYELYPLIANLILKWEPPVGRMLYISGLPFHTKVVDEVKFNEGFAPTSRRADIFTKRVQVVEWEGVNSRDANDAAIPLYDMEILNRVYVIEGMSNSSGVRLPTRREEVPSMYNTIHEGDNAIFFFSHFFPGGTIPPPKHVYLINDGDAISIGVLRALEDIRGPETTDREHWLCLPIKSNGKKGKLAALGARNCKFQYINLTKLCREMDTHPQLRNLQSPIASMIFLIILSGTDFFNGEFCFGIGGKGKINEKTGELRTYGIWDTFFEGVASGQYSHLVQFYPNVRDPMTERRIVIDRVLFRVFTESCYTNRFGRKKGSTYDMLVAASANQKNPKKKLPDEGIIYRWSSQIDWNMNYWANAWRNIYIDPFRKVDGKSYYGYEEKEGSSGTITNIVAMRQDPPLDEVYKRHFVKRVEAAVAAEPVQKRAKVNPLDLIRGK